MRPTRGPRRRARSHADGGAVLLGHPAEPGLDDLADLGELGRGVDLLVGGRRHLGLERAPELLERGEVVDGGAAHAHPCNLAPASSMWQATLRHDPNRSPTVAYLRLVEISARTVEERHRLAHAEVACRPAVGPPERAREEPVGAPAAEPALRGDRLDHERVGQLVERGEVERRCARARSRTRPCGSRSRPRGSRSRPRRRCARASGTPTPRSCRTPKRSISRERTANAEWSDTCCAVIRVTSISHGSGTSGGR